MVKNQITINFALNFLYFQILQILKEHQHVNLTWSANLQQSWIIDTGIGKLERAYSFNQALENYPNYEQSNYNVRVKNPNIFGNSQDFSCIDRDHASFSDLCDNVLDPLSSIKRQTLFDNEIQLQFDKLQASSVYSRVYKIHQYNYIICLWKKQKFKFVSIKYLNFIGILEALHQQNLFKSLNFHEKQSNSRVQNFLLILKILVYDIKSQMLQLKQYEPQLPEIPLIDPIIDKQKKRLLEEQKKGSQLTIRQIEQKFNLHFKKLYQQVDKRIIQPCHNYLQIPFNIQNQFFLANQNLFSNFTNSNPFSNIMNKQQGFSKSNFKTMSNSFPFTKNSFNSNKSKSYNTRSGRS
ncbi:unnamed protein product [Paramecium primaurelia]|uniref:Uncharacterized protein n=1 Tax=Paramecium primaurelia TaxID=5886 RepID=A0A8S1LKB4_PARPR|nr:unnamed protein product [Paramecium primaurelia]